MKINILLVIAFLLTSCTSKKEKIAKWNELVTKSITCLPDNKQQAITTAEEALSYAKEEFGENDTNFITSLFILGSAYKEVNNIDKAELYYLELISKYPQVKYDKKTYAEIEFRLANIYTDNNIKLDSANLLLSDVIKIRKELSNDNYYNDTIIANCYFILGANYYKCNNLFQSKKMFLKAIDLYYSSIGPFGEMYLTTLNQLAIVYENTNIDSTNILLKEVATKRKQMYEQSHSDNSLALKYAKSLEPLYVLYFENNNLQLGLPLLMEDIEIKKQILGENSSDYAISICWLAMIYLKARNFDESEKLYIHALNVLKQNHHEDYKDYLVGLYNLYKVVGNKYKADSIYNILN